MTTDLAEARRNPLFPQSALTKLLWAPRSRKSIDSLVRIIEKEPLFQKQQKSPRWPGCSLRQILPEPATGSVESNQGTDSSVGVTKGTWLEPGYVDYCAFTIRRSVPDNAAFLRVYGRDRGSGDQRAD
jgi:hypothetical protein